MMGMVVYIQIAGMDLKRYRLSDYLAHDSSSATWWQLAPLPFIVGVCFIGIAVRGVKRSSQPKGALLSLALSFVLSMLLLVAGSPFGIFASICVLILAVPPAIVVLRNRSRNGQSAT
jgi:hypothetical protein